MKERRRLTLLLAFSLYIVIWEVLAIHIGSRVLLPSPVSVLKRLIEFLGEPSFYLSVLFSLSRIFLGLVLAIALSLVTAPLCYRSRSARIMAEPVIMVMRSAPVASITILILIWVSSRNLSVVISFMMVFPVMHTSLFDGLSSLDGKLIEMARLYRVSPFRKFRYLYLPLLIPAFESGLSISLALCFKSGIAAEVIAVPDGSIGEKLYEAKLYLASSDLFAWTLTIIILAKAFEKMLFFLIQKALRRIEV